MPSVTVSVRGQIALPADVRRELGIVGGSRLEVEISSGAVILRPLRGGKNRVSVADGRGIIPNTVGPMSSAAMNARIDEAFRKGRL